jgi:hypothetical protein
MLDDFRIGLHIRDEIRVIQSCVDLSQVTTPECQTRSIFSEGMRRGEWALGLSVEEISLSRRLVGFMNTRSKYARLGLELMRSSWLVAPGFGEVEPTTIVFELRAYTDLCGFRVDECYAYLLLFELHHGIEGDTRDYIKRFPLSDDAMQNLGS